MEAPVDSTRSRRGQPEDGWSVYSAQLPDAVKASFLETKSRLNVPAKQAAGAAFAVFTSMPEIVQRAVIARLDQIMETDAKAVVDKLLWPYVLVLALVQITDLAKKQRKSRDAPDFVSDQIEGDDGKFAGRGDFLEGAFLMPLLASVDAIDASRDSVTPETDLMLRWLAKLDNSQFSSLEDKGFLELAAWNFASAKMRAAQGGEAPEL